MVEQIQLYDFVQLMLECHTLLLGIAQMERKLLVQLKLHKMVYMVEVSNIMVMHLLHLLMEKLLIGLHSMAIIMEHEQKFLVMLIVVQEM